MSRSIWRRLERHICERRRLTIADDQHLPRTQFEQRCLP